MITSTEYFEKHISTIKDLILTEDNNEPKTIYITTGQTDYTMSEEGLNEWYGTCFKSFPIYTTYVSSDVSVHCSFRHYFLQYYKNDDFQEEPGKPRSVVVEDMERFGLLLDLQDYIEEWVHNMYYDFSLMMEKLKAGPVFACVDDTLTIMKNLLNFYSDIRQSDEIQLVFFNRVSMPKPVTDQMTDVLIELLTDKIKMLGGLFPKQNTEAGTPVTSSFKISWNGSQQEFAELINTLIEKGYWNFPDTSIAAQARHLAGMFDFSASQKKKGADVSKNLLAYLSPIQDKETKQTTYAYCKPGYKSRFSCINQLKSE